MTWHHEALLQPTLDTVHPMALVLAHYYWCRCSVRFGLEPSVCSKHVVPHEGVTLVCDRRGGNFFLGFDTVGLGNAFGIGV